MKWEEYIESKESISIPYPYGLEKTDIECPKCGEPLYKNTRHVLACYPPKYGFECIECGWYGTA